MKLYEVYDGESIAKKIDELIDSKYHKKYRIENRGTAGSSWMFDSNLEPYLLLDIDELSKVIKKFTDKELDVYLNDPFVGLFPHEINEAEVTKMLLMGRVGEVLQKYPKYKLTPHYKKLLNDLTPVNSLEQFKNTDTFDFKYEPIAGLAHEIIISDNPKEYYKYTIGAGV